MAGKTCDTCGKEITVYPCGPTTCGLCIYEREAKEELASLHKKLDEYFARRIAEVCSPKYIGEKDSLFSSILEVINKMEDKDVDAINYIIDSIKERF